MNGGEDSDDARREAWTEVQEFRDRVQAGQWVTGILRAHGAANYRYNEDAEPSYYLKLRTAHGDQTLWGKGLEEAIVMSKSHVKVGQRVGVRITEHEPLPNGRIRNHWEVESPEFVTRRNRIAREILEHPVTARQRAGEHPEITGSYLAIRGAELLANVRYTDERDRREFVRRVREAIGLPAVPFTPREPAEQQSGSPSPQAQTQPRFNGAPRAREPFTRE